MKVSEKGSNHKMILCNFPVIGNRRTKYKRKEKETHKHIKI